MVGRGGNWKIPERLDFRNTAVSYKQELLFVFVC